MPSSSGGSGSFDSGTYASQLISLINAERAKNNLPALTVNSDLASYAQTRVGELADVFDSTFDLPKTRPNGSLGTDYINKDLKYKYFAESRCTGLTPEAALEQLLKLSETKGSILNANLTYFGVACYKAEYNVIWAIEYGGK